MSAPTRAVPWVAEHYEMTFHRNGVVVITFDLPPSEGEGPKGAVRSVRYHDPVLNCLTIDFDHGSIALPDVDTTTMRDLLSASFVNLRWYCHADCQIRGDDVSMSSFIDCMA